MDFEVNGEKLGRYYDPSSNSSLFANVSFEGVRIEYQRWKTIEGYGPFYNADKVQNNSPWTISSELFSLESNNKINESFNLTSSISVRGNEFKGDWIEARADNETSEPYDSYVSFTSWRTESNSTLFNQTLNYQHNPSLSISANIKYERKELTKAYDIPGYYGAFSSSALSTLPGPYGYGTGVFHSGDPLYIRPNQPLPEMPSDNIAHTSDFGGYLIADISDSEFHYSLGVRYDENSVYGQSFNPRLSAIYDYSNETVFKIIYGEAFQEPAPILRYGGYNGRRSNENLQPEDLKNIELLFIHSQELFNVQGSLYFQKYESVIRTASDQGAQQDIYGIQLSSKFIWKNLFGSNLQLNSFANYTYTQSRWGKGSDYISQLVSEVGDETGFIAPHKLNLGGSLTLSDNLHFSLRGNFASGRPHSVGSGLRELEKATSSNFVLNGYLGYTTPSWRIGFKVDNLLDKSYFNPTTAIYSGNLDSSQRSTSFNNPLIPQPERTSSIVIGYDF